jgi:hypothetical protein
MRGPLGTEEELPRLFAEEMENEDEMSGEGTPRGWSDWGAEPRGPRVGARGRRGRRGPGWRRAGGAPGLRAALPPCWRRAAKGAGLGERRGAARGRPRAGRDPDPRPRRELG